MKMVFSPWSHGRDLITSYDRVETTTLNLIRSSINPLKSKISPPFSTITPRFRLQPRRKMKTIETFIMICDDDADSYFRLIIIIFAFDM